MTGHKQRLFWPLLITLFLCIHSYGQNLVPNPSFENYGSLPCSWITSESGFSSAMNDWIMPTDGSSDVFSTLVSTNCFAHCLSTSPSSPGRQLPRTGDIMSAILTYGFGCGSQANYREYLEVELISPLVVGNTYYAEMYVSHADNSQHASNNISMYFSETLVTDPSSCFHLNGLTPQVIETKLVTDSVNWVKISGTFVATTPARYLILGNFYDNANTTYVEYPSNSSMNARYFVDDVSVTLACGSGGTEALAATVTGNDAFCDQNNGSANVMVTGGSKPYSYKWSNGATTATVDGLAPGKYTVEVSDGSCNVKESVSIGTYGAFTVTGNVDYSAGCDRQGSVNASATVTPSGGAEPYKYQWNDAKEQTTQTAVGLPSDTYLVEVADSNGCTVIEKVIVEDRIQIEIQVIAHPSCNTCADGDVVATIKGFGAPPYTYRWDDESGQTTLQASGLKTGKYTITVTDSSDCRSTASVIIGHEGIVTYDDLSDPIVLFPNPTTGVFRIDDEGMDVNEVSIRVRDIQGKFIYQSSRLNEFHDISGFPEGIYIVEIVSKSGILYKKLHLLR